MSTNDPIDLSPKEAFEMIQSDQRTLLVDIRSSMEYLFVGHPKGALHIPWMDEPDWTRNPRFVPEVRKLLLGGAGQDGEDHGTSIILICRSGKRSLDAGRELIAADIPRVYHVGEGFEGDLDEHHHRSSINGWRYHGLPWEQC